VLANACELQENGKENFHYGGEKYDEKKKKILLEDSIKSFKGKGVLKSSKTLTDQLNMKSDSTSQIRG